MNTTGLVRITVAAPRRRIDLALPERSPLAELLPGLLKHAGITDTQLGWVLRRADGSTLAPSRTLGAHRVRDGEVLHLGEAREPWPELEYDDVVDAIATGSAKHGKVWGPRHTRNAGLAVGAVAALLALLVTRQPEYAAAAAALLLLAGTLVARAGGDAGAGAVLAGLALPFAAVTGVLAVDATVPKLLTASAAALLAGLVALIGTAHSRAAFTAAITTALIGVAAAATNLVTGLDAPQTAAATATFIVLISPFLGSWAIRLGALPVPLLPQGPQDLVRDTEQPPRTAVYAAVVRTDGLLTGMIAGTATALAACQILLAQHHTTATLLLIGVTAAATLLRARVHRLARHRIPLLIAGLAGPAALLPHDWKGVLIGLTTTALATTIGLRYSTQRPTPYLARYAELAEMITVLAVVPLACWVLGLYARLRGLAG